MTEVTFIIPVCPGEHEKLMERAIASVKAQTISSTAIWLIDEHFRGPAYCRNLGLQRAATPYVAFLDSDDWLEPDFVEKCLRLIEPSKFVFCDWWQDDVRKIAPEHPWIARQDGVIDVAVNCALAATADVRRVSGYDEMLPGAEDTDFWLKLTYAGVLGIHLNEPLFHYGKEGQRSHNFVSSGAYKRTLQEIYDRYRHLPDPYAPPPIIYGERRAGMVKAMAMWDGNHVLIGKSTGYQYPRVGNGKLAWVYAEDVRVDANNWREVSEDRLPNPFAPRSMQTVPLPTANGLPALDLPFADGSEEVARLLFGANAVPKVVEKPQAVAPTAARPNVRQIIELVDSAGK